MPKFGGHESHRHGTTTLKIPNATVEMVATQQWDYRWQLFPKRGAGVTIMGGH